jgi:predicted RNase H-like nuclease (RuvC/YqgF family)
MTDPGRPDTDNIRRIEQMRTTFDRLRTERIRAESEVERLERELEQAREAARAAFGTDDEHEIGRAVEAARAKNTQLVEEFGSLLRDIESRLRALGDQQR